MAEVRPIMESPQVALAIPLAYGDSYRSYRILGTTPAYVENYDGEFARGRMFEAPMEAVVGATVARLTGLDYGSTFVGTHGDAAGGHVHEEHKYLTVGVLKSTGTVLDNLIITDVASVWIVHDGHHGAHDDHSTAEDERVEDHHHHDHEHDDHDHRHGQDQHNHHDDDLQHGHNHDHDHGAHEHDHRHDHADHHHHDHDHGDHDHDADHHGREAIAFGSEPDSMELTAVLMKYRNKLTMLNMPRIINQQTTMQAVLPALEINRLFQMIGIGVSTIRLIAFAIMFMSAFSVFFVLYNRLRERVFELALLRAVGYGRRKLFELLIWEGLGLTVAGVVLGLLLSRVGLWLVNSKSVSDFSFRFSAGLILPELWLVGLTLAVGLLAALLPAIKATRINVPEVLARR